MRGRSILRQSSTPSLCAFCEHRLGQARKPSHVQRRFLQSSRPVAKPPAEAAAVREVQDDDSSAPTWGRPGTLGGNGSGPTWGRPGGGIPVAPGGGNGTGPTPSWGRAAGSIPSGTAATSAQASRPPPDDLLPHERQARDRILEEQARTRRRPLPQPVGPGPQAFSSGRPLPWSIEEQRRIAPDQVDRRLGADPSRNMDRQRAGFGARDQAGPRITHIMGDFDDAKELNIRTPNWTGLRRKVEQRPEDRRPLGFEGVGFAQRRAQREQQSSSGAYTPLARKSVFRSPLDSGNSERTGHRYTPSARDGTERFTISRIPDREIPSPGTRGPGDYRARTELQSESRDQESGLHHPTGFADRRQLEDVDDRTPVSFSPLAPPTESKASPVEANPAPVTREQEEERPAREKRERRIRSRYDEEEQPSYAAKPKGKDKDKARRKQRFVNEEEDDAEQEAIVARNEAKKRRREEKAAKKKAAPTPMFLPEYISVSNLAVALKVRFEDFVAKMEELGFEQTSYDHILTAENAGLIAMEYNFEPIIDRSESEDLRAREPAEDPSILPQRPPVVTIMGHVDHGKTTLLDYLRKASVAATEHGGITQHIGAFSVPMPGGKLITFLDTPGHAAFLSMRQRGANVTDIVILVVAADDSVKPQTIEAINHARAAKVPIIVAINKIDKPDTNIERVKQDLARHGVDVEDFGGDVQAICVSGKTGEGMEELEEAAVTLSEILDMRAEVDGPAEGWVLEASVKSMGKVATVLVRRGTMRPGDFIVAGKTWARIRCLRNEAGVEILEAGPGTPVEIDGWREQPLAGDEVLQAPDEDKAKSVVDYRLENEERNKMAEDMEAINANRKEVDEKREFEKAQALAAAEAAAAGEEVQDFAKDKDSKDVKKGPKQIYFIIKGDVSGSVEAVIDSIAAIGNQEVQPHILRSGVGQLSEFDIEHAAVAKGVLINFNTTVEPNIARLAEISKVKIIDHNIIYRLVDDVKAELSKHLTPLVTQKVLGEAEISQVFSINVKGRVHKNIAGCKVRNGTIGKNAKVRVLRDGEKIFDGLLSSLKNVKKDVMEMKKGSECGMGFENWFEFQVGDQIQSYEEKEEKRFL